jgi:hypothetical protein
MTKHSHPLGLTAYEWSVIVDCLNAYKRVPNGHFLPAFAKFAAARRMAEQGYLTLVDELQPGGWPVVKITEKNIEFYNSQLQKVMEVAR